jgi:glycosyltransferase involved in cell wall biosynthesis
VRVCLITPRYPPDRCGVGDYTELLACHLAQRGIAVTVVTSRGLAAQGAGRGHGGVKVLPLIDEWGWRSLPHLVALVAAGRYDVAHVQYQNEMYGRSAAIAALPLALRVARVKTPTVVTVHDYGTPWPRRVRVRLLAGPYGKAWFAVMLLASARIILTNEQDEWRFVRQRLRYPVPASRYAIIPVGSNLPVVIPSERNPTTNQVTFGYFGFVNPAKGVDILLDAFALAHQQRPDLRLTLICALRPHDPYHGMLLRKLEDEALRDAVTLTGELDDDEAARTLAGCTLIVLPFRDGVSLRRTTLMAALALGRPVISTRAAVPPAAVHDGRTFVLVPPADAVALARAMVELADDPDRRRTLGEQARAAAGAFTWPAIAAQTEDLYRRVLSPLDMP